MLDDECVYLGGCNLSCNNQNTMRIDQRVNDALNLQHLLIVSLAQKHAHHIPQQAMSWCKALWLLLLVDRFAWPACFYSLEMLAV